MDKMDNNAPASPVTERSVVPVNLRCEYAAQPLGIDVERPRFFWVIRGSAGRRALFQRSYRLLVASSADELAQDHGDMWDSGQVESSQSIQVPYGGKPLESDTKYYWKVRVWCTDGSASDWSDMASFTTGLFRDDDWKGTWIAWKPENVWREDWERRRWEEQQKNTGCNEAVRWYQENWPNNLGDPAPLLRKEFMLDKPVRKAFVHVCGLGYYELYINRGKVGDHVLDPGGTRYDKRVLYETYDVTGLIHTGSNAIGLMLGNGWYNTIYDSVWGFHTAGWTGQPKAILQLNIEYADGSHAYIATDGTWKASGGPVLFNDVRTGEVYDARHEKPGWSSAGYDDSAWDYVAVVEGPRGKLRKQMVQPIKVMETVKPVGMTEPKPGTYVYDLGQVMAGWFRMAIDGVGNRGKSIIFKMGSGVEGDGTVSMKTDGRLQQYIYTMKGEPGEICEPHFVYYAFRYIQVEDFPGKPSLESLEGCRVHTSVAAAGSFSCSDDLINRVHQNILRTQLNNMHSIPTDCSNREKLGWTCDAHVTAEEVIYNFDAPLFYTKYIDDLMDSQVDNGGLPAIAPTYGWGGIEGPPWTIAYILISWYLYEYYGDRRILETHYDSFKRWVDSIEGTLNVDKPYIVNGGPGDWCPPNHDYPDAPEGNWAIGTAYYYYSALLMSRIAAVLEQDSDALKYTSLANKIKEAFNHEFFDFENRIYHGNNPSGYRQTPNAAALYLGLVDERHRQAVIDALVEDILVCQDGHLNTGFIGTKLLMELLPSIGRADVAYTIISQKSYPGWIWPILAYGATTIPEWWCGGLKHGGGTHNHPALGSVGSYFYKYFAGIRPGSPGFERIVIRPETDGGLTYVEASYESIRGTIASAWRKYDNSMVLKATIPANSIARISVPKCGLKSVTITEHGREVWVGGRFLRGAEGGRDVAGNPSVDGIISAVEEEKYITFETGSGDYHFEVKAAG